MTNAEEWRNGQKLVGIIEKNFLRFHIAMQKENYPKIGILNKKAQKVQQRDKSLFADVGRRLLNL